MPKENNNMQVDIENLFKQNVNDLCSIKELYRKLQDMENKILQIKYIDSNLVNKLKKEYENLKKIILDENVQAKLANDIKTINSQLDNIESNKADIKVELLDTLACNNALFKLKNNANYPILQGGCLSDDGLNYYCCSVTNSNENETGIIDKYSVGNVSDFSTWKHVKTSSELNTSHGNDMTYFNNMLYLTNTNANPNEIILINPSTLNVERTINIKYGATAITYNKKLNQFITRRKNEWSTFDFYDINFNYIKTNNPNGVTFDTVQGINSDDNYIYSLSSDVNFGNSVVVFDLNGNFVKRMGSNTMSEIEHMTNFNGYFITGYYKKGANYLSISTLRTDKRMTASRYILNQGRNTVLTDNTQYFNGTIPLNFNRKYFSHLSFNITVDNVDVETKILDITKTFDTMSFILNSFRMTGNGQVIFYRSLLVVRETSMEITPVVLHQINADGSRVVKTYANEPSAFTKTNSISISNVCGQILCGLRVTE